MPHFQFPPPRQPLPLQPPYYLARPEVPGPGEPGPDEVGPEGPGYVPTDEELARLAELGVVDEEMATNMQRQRAAELAASAGPPEGRAVAGTYVAASPLEHLASAGGRAAALVRRHQLREEEKDILGRKRAGYRGLYDVGFQAYGHPKPFSW